MILLTLLDPAQAYVIACRPEFITATLPAAGAEGVPVDVLPAFVWENQCEAGGSYTASLWQGDTELASEDFERPDDFAGLERLMLQDLLEPETTYLLQVEGQHGTLAESEFTTGSHQVLGAEAPEVSSVEHQAWRVRTKPWSLWTTVEGSLGADEDALSAVRLVDEDGRVLAASAWEDFHLRVYEAGLDEAPEQRCVTLIQEDGLGTPSEPLELCEAVEADTDLVGGCSSTPAGASLLLGLLGLLGLKRRQG